MHAALGGAAGDVRAGRPRRVTPLVLATLVGAAALVPFAAAVAAAAPAPLRFFVAGDGTLAVVNGHTDEQVSVRYRRPDGTYDEAAIARLRRLFRSADDSGDGRLALRLVEVLSRVQALAGGKRLVLVSGYRTPGYNETIRRQGAKAAAGSLHTEGLAADLAFPRPILRPLWLKVRSLDCCGAGYYAKEGFLHVDVGRPRFWEAATSRVDENLSAGNARLFARTEYDRYATGEPIAVTLHALTVPPVRIARTARLGGHAARVEAELPERDGCFEVGASGAAVRVVGAAPTSGRAPVALAVCEPRPERTPVEVETNAVEVGR
ncbi:MAG TPA: DUF882 domain-containing protein [Candidatus Binatia bacterium]|nr:DUF882 domain-containing protein [Candidatus Binatia bacterium]